MDTTKGGPVFKLEAADLTNFHIQYIEWSNSDAIVTADLLPATTDTGAQFIGGYTAAAKEMYFNPLVTTNAVLGS